MTSFQLPTARSGGALFRGTLIGISTLALLAAPARASMTGADTARAAVATSPDEATVRANAESHRARARTLLETGRRTQARRELLAAARVLREGGVLPEQDMLAAATLALVDERPLVAAEVMDVLAADAAAFGRPLLQAEALVHAATQYAIAGRHEIARERVATLRPLLSSPHIPESFRTEVAARIMGERPASVSLR
jgi:hypothetical protein